MYTTLKIEGMMCEHCAGRVKAALSALPGVSAVTVSVAEKTATVQHSGADEAAMRNAVDALGYEVTGFGS